MEVGLSGFRPNREGEALSRRAKRYIKWWPGTRVKAKRKFWKQTRKLGKRDLERADGF